VTDFQLPDHSQLIAESVFGQRLQSHNVVDPGLGFIGWAAGQALFADVSYCPGRSANLDYLPWLRYGRQPDALRALKPRRLGL